MWLTWNKVIVFYGWRLTSLENCGRSQQVKDTILHRLIKTLSFPESVHSWTEWSIFSIWVKSECWQFKWNLLSSTCCGTDHCAVLSCSNSFDWVHEAPVVTGLDAFSKPVEKHFNLPNHSKQQIWQSAAFPYQCPTSRKHGKRKISKTKNILF